MALKIKHVGRRPTAAPTTEQLNRYHLTLWSRHVNSGLQYRSGPRHGQQLADERKPPPRRTAMTPTPDDKPRTRAEMSPRATGTAVLIQLSPNE
jgi:hypothetical protein